MFVRLRLQPRATLIVAATLLLTTAACGPRDATEDRGAPPAPETSLADDGLPTDHPPLPQSAPGGDFVSFEAEVLETMDGGGYTYARLDRGEDEVWVAGPTTPLTVGARVVIRGATSMGGFESESLQRSFDDLYFTGAFLEPFPEEGTTEGLVQEVLSAAGYTYLRVQAGTEDLWLAGPGVEVQVGETVRWAGGTAMGEFTSTTLGRTFDDILFVERIGVR